MSKPLWAQITTYYSETARAEGIALLPIPGGTLSEQPPADQSALIQALNRNSNMIEALVVMLARREGITLHDLAEAESSLVDQIAAVAGQAAAIEAIQRDPILEPGAPPQPAHKPRLLEPAKP